MEKLVDQTAEAKVQEAAAARARRAVSAQEAGEQTLDALGEAAPLSHEATEEAIWSQEATEQATAGVSEEATE